MAVLASLPAEEFCTRLREGELRLRVGPYTYRLHSDLGVLEEGLWRLYADFPLGDDDGFVDFNVSLLRRGAAPWSRKSVNFLFENQRPFESISLDHAYAFTEWGMNWCVSVHVNEHLKLHAAVVAREGQAIVMPGVPGAGKSTLCAALALRGWRVLSDEHALVPPGTAEVVPLCRPVSLKNQSIDVIRAYEPTAVFGPLSVETHKGSVAHIKGDLHPHSHDTGNLPVHSLVFPRYSPDEPQQLSARSSTESFVLSAYHAFNYSLLGQAGFDAMERLLSAVECYDLVYHELDWGVAALQRLLAGEQHA